MKLVMDENVQSPPTNCLRITAHGYYRHKSACLAEFYFERTYTLEPEQHDKALADLVMIQAMKDKKEIDTAAEMEAFLEQNGLHVDEIPTDSITCDYLPVVNRYCAMYYDNHGNMHNLFVVGCLV